MTLAWSAATLRPIAARAGQGWRPHLTVLALLVAALLLAFRRDVADLATIWWTNTTFGHCLFVPPVVGWLIWNRRAELAELHPTGWWPGLALVAGACFGWLLGEAAGVALVRHVALAGMIWGAVAAVLGPNVGRGLLFPLAYLVFAVPAGEELEGPLQTVTVEMVTWLLAVAGVPAHVEGVLITIPNGWFEVAEACSGSKFVIAMSAFGVLVAHLCYQRWDRRAAFLAAALIVPVIANGLRAFGTIYAAHLTSVEAATGFDHIVYGWVFFGLVMALTLAIGWHWFDRDPDAPAFDPATLQGPVSAAGDARLVAAAAAAIALAALAWAAAIAARTDTLPATAGLPEVPGWTRVATPVTPRWVPNYPGADRFRMARYQDREGRTVDVAVAVYAGQREGRELVAFGQGAIRQNDRWVRIEDRPPLDGGTTLAMVQAPVVREVATWYVLRGVTTGEAMRVKLETLRARLLGGPQRAAAVLISAPRTGRDPESARTAMRLFLDAAGSPARLAAALGGA